jgi:Cu(I)/Ag(I) efflux system membrane fusion protein
MNRLLWAGVLLMAGSASFVLGHYSRRPGTQQEAEVKSSISDGKLPSGAIRIDRQKQRLIGVRVETAERGSGARLTRTTGRVAVIDDNLYRVIVGTEGWVRSLQNSSVGTVVRKDEPLAVFYSNDFLKLEQSFLFTLHTLDRVRSSGHDSADQIRQAEEQARSYEETLRSAGMGNPQIKELIKTRVATRDIAIASPADGLVVARNLSPSQQLERGTEVYRIADLTKIWILADVFTGEAPLLPPGTKVRVVLRETRQVLSATVTRDLPIFDPESRALKVRLIADNPRLVLRPEMFVDLEFATRVPTGISVPVDAVLDSGLRKIVYVETQEGIFEARPVEVGAAYGNRIAIAAGLREGERVVVAGNFLIDSESRMRSGALRTAALKN